VEGVFQGIAAARAAEPFVLVVIRGLDYVSTVSRYSSNISNVITVL
jgi:hypothetical protein